MDLPFEQEGGVGKDEVGRQKKFAIGLAIC